jgi:hypothetical protein
MLVYFMDISSIFLPIGLFYGHLAYHIVIWNIPPLWCVLLRKNLATLLPTRSGIFPPITSFWGAYVSCTYFWLKYSLVVMIRQRTNSKVTLNYLFPQKRMIIIATNTLICQNTRVYCMYVRGRFLITLCSGTCSPTLASSFDVKNRFNNWTIQLM